MAISFDKTKRYDWGSNVGNAVFTPKTDADFGVTAPAPQGKTPDMGRNVIDSILSAGGHTTPNVDTKGIDTTRTPYDGAGNITRASLGSSGLVNRDINDEYANPMRKANGFRNLEGNANSPGFNDRINTILNQGRLMQQQFENQANGNYGNVSVADIVRRNQEALGNAKDMAWAHQNPMGENMGYVWNDDKMKALGWSDDDIAQIKSITDMHPQMIQDLYARGILRAPYREYLDQQARLEAEALARAEAAAATSYNYSDNYNNYDTAEKVDNGRDQNRTLSWNELSSDANAYDRGGYNPNNPPTGWVPKTKSEDPYSYESLQRYYDDGVFRDT